MELTLNFIALFADILLLAMPLIISLLAFIILLGALIGIFEKWHPLESLYWTMVTSFAIGYGDRTPSKPFTKLLTIFIAFFGLIFNGIIVAIAVTVATMTFHAYVHDHADLKKSETAIERKLQQ